MGLVHFTDDTFSKEVLGSSVPVVVDFYADWCGPCKMIAPIVEELAASYKGKALVGKVNVEDAPLTASQYGIMSIPALLFFKDGKIVSQMVGAASRSEIEGNLTKMF